MARLGGRALAIVILAAAALASGSGGCSNSGNAGFNAESEGGASGGSSGSGSGSSSGAPVSGILPTTGDGGGFNFSADSSVSNACVTGLCNQVPQGCTTSLSGTVYDPAGTTPLYNAVVFVPKDPAGAVPPITPGITPGVCNTCDVSIGGFVKATTTDSRGHFSLSNVPAGKNIPFVVQMGKWRRKSILPSVTACKDTPVPADMSRLPKSQAEGDMPQMALLTGGCDDLGCFMSSIGIDPTEFSSPGAGGRLDVYTGGDAAAMGGPSAPLLSGGRAGTPVDCSTNPCPLWSSKANLEKYDIVILACECGENPSNKPDKQPLHDWLAEGGKAFATHYHYAWFKNGPPDFQGVANFTSTSDVAAVNGPFKTDVSFPKGMALQDWLGSQSLLNSDLSIPLNPPDVKTSVTSTNTPSLRWIFDTSTNNVKYMSFLTPIGGIPASMDASSPSSADASSAQYCGKAVFTDIHTSGAPSGNIPGDCAPMNLTPQQKALEFLFFDLSSCVQPDTLPPFEPAK
jgi:hypothetical protein